MPTTVPDSVDALRAQIAAGLVPKFLCFWGHEPKHFGRLERECLSQWYEAPFTVAGDLYATAEHFMMVGKARLFGDTEMATRILAAKHPGEAKQLGRAVRDFDGAIWERERVRIVRDGNLAKFGQHAALRAFLLATGERILVEASPVDRIWGIGLAANDPDAERPERWRGLNLLGFALMQVRATLLASAATGA
jgi:ribA/ribD-fused uncharacterized protein